MLNSEMAEEIYRIFAVSVLSKGTAQDANEVKQLEDLQMLLGISADRFVKDLALETFFVLIYPLWCIFGSRSIVWACCWHSD